MSKNKIEDLADHLFSQLERLGDEGLTGEGLKLEVARSRAIVEVSSQLVEVGKLSVAAKQLELDAGGSIGLSGVLGIGVDRRSNG